MKRFLTLLPAVLILLIFPVATHAQPTCDDLPPPFDNPDLLANWQTVWDKTDICISIENVFTDEEQPIMSGGVPRDGIPPIDNPTFDDQSIADLWLQPQSPVIAVDVDGIARAYPLAILTRHEIVNDVIGETALAVTYCPLCNSAVVYDRTVDGNVLRFGVSGFLRNSDLIMWDDLTQSWWQQFTGEGIVGTYTGHLLDIVPSQVVGYGAFKEQYPDGQVLSTQGRNYGENPYVGYDSNGSPFFFERPDARLFPVSRVLGANINGEQIAYPFAELQAEMVINDTVGGTDVVAVWQPGSVSAMDQAWIDDSRDVGMAALFNRNLGNQVLTFSIIDEQIIDDQTGSTWNIFGTATAGELAGQQLMQINAFPHFWFAWEAFYPETAIYNYQPPTADELMRLELDPVYGDPNAPITLIEYGAYGCPACKFWHEEGFIDDILEEFEGQVKLVFRDMPTVAPQYSQMAAEVAQCAFDQGNDLFWDFHDALYTIAKQDVSTRDDLIEIGKQVGLDADALRTCAEAGTHASTVTFDYTRGIEAGVRGTPTFFLNDQPFFNASPDILRDAINAELAKLED